MAHLCLKQITLKFSNCAQQTRGGRISRCCDGGGGDGGEDAVVFPEYQCCIASARIFEVLTK